jgi:WD40 repeat protein
LANPVAQPAPGRDNAHNSSISNAHPVILTEDLAMWRRFAPVAVLFTLATVCHDAAAQMPVSPKQRVDSMGNPLPEGAIARLGSIGYRHGGKQLVGFSVDGKSLLLHGGGAVHWMDVQTGKISKTVRCGDGSASVGSAKGRKGEGQGAVLSGDGRVLVHVDEADNAFGVLDATTGKETKRIKASEVFKSGESLGATRFQLTGDGKLLIVFGQPFSLGNWQLLWLDITTGKRLHSVEIHKGGSWTHAQVSHDKKQIVAASTTQGPKGDQNGRLHIFDAANAKEIRSLEVANDMFQREAEFQFVLRPDGKTLIGWWVQEFPGRKGDPALYDMTAEKELKKVHKLGDNSSILSVVLSKDGKTAYLRNNSVIEEWDVDGGKLQRSLALPLENNKENYFGLGRFPPGPVLSADGKLLAATGSKAVAVYDLVNNAPITPEAIGEGIALLRFAPDGETLVTGSTTYSNWLWDVKQAKPLRKLVTPPGGVPLPGRGDFFSALFGGVSFSSDGKLVALSIGERGVKIWSMATGKHLYRLAGEENEGSRDVPGAAFAFAPKGSLLATASGDGLVRLWDASTGKQLRQWNWHKGEGKNLRESGMLALAFSPDGKTLAGNGFTALGGDREGATVVILWETATGRERLRLQSGFDLGGARDEFVFIALILDQFAMAMTFSPDGKTLAMGSFTNLHLIDTVTGKDVRTISGRLCIGKTATFSKDGKLLFVGRYDGGIRVLDVATGRIVRELPAHEESVFVMALSPDGKTLASGSADATVLFWDVAAISKPISVAPAVLSAKQLAALWDDLADNNAAKAYQAINQLAASPAEAAPFLKARLKPIPHIDPKLLDKLFDELNSEKFKVREKASFELEKLGDLALGELQKRLVQKPTLELRQRMEKLLLKLLGPVTSPEMMQQMRAIEALEKMGTPEALEVLVGLAKGAPGHRVTEDASAAAKRLRGQ